MSFPPPFNGNRMHLHLHPIHSGRVTSLHSSNYEKVLNLLICLWLKIKYLLPSTGPVYLVVRFVMASTWEDWSKTQRRKVQDWERDANVTDSPQHRTRLRQLQSQKAIGREHQVQNSTFRHHREISDANRFVSDVLSKDTIASVTTGAATSEGEMVRRGASAAHGQREMSERRTNNLSLRDSIDSASMVESSEVCVKYMGSVGGVWPTPQVCPDARSPVFSPFPHLSPHHPPTCSHSQRGHWFPNPRDIETFREKIRLLCPRDEELVSLFLLCYLSCFFGCRKKKDFNFPWATN